jgi:hypothetical protein
MAEITTKDVLTLEELKNLTGQAAKAAVIYDTSTGEPSGLDVEIFINMDASIGVVDASVQALEQQASDLTQAIASEADTRAAADDLKSDKATQIAAGAGLTGGGDLSENRTINVVSADDGITVNADNIKLNIVNDLVTTSATRALSATQGKKLQDEKEALVNKSTDIVADTGSSEKYPSVVATEAYATPRYDNEAIDLDNLGDVRARSIDVDNLPKISGFDMFVISTTAPSVAPDFIPQIWVDTTAKKAYIAVGVSTSADFIALN